MNQNPTTAVVILNWNGKHFLEEYLPKVESYSQFPDVSIVVTDNGSTDDSVSYLQKYHPNVRLILLDKNYGFAEGYNRALQQVDSDYFVLLNSDVEVTENWLQPLIDQMQTSGVAACMPKIRSVADRTSFEYAGAAGGFIDRLGYPFCRGRIFHTVEKDTGQYDSPIEIFWATGACCLIKADIFRQMGGFDAYFFAHMEEIDLCWRIKNAGYTIRYTPESTVYHVGGGMLPQKSPFKTYLNYRNNLLMMYKNLPKKHKTRTLAFRIILDTISSFHSLLQGDTSVIKAVWKAHASFWKALPQYQKLSVEQPLSFPSCVYPRSLVFQYFIKRKKYYREMIRK